MSRLADLSCKDVETGALAPDEAKTLLGALAQGWEIEGDRLTRRFETGKFAPALLMANAVGYVAEAEGHHPDLALGWGYLVVTLTTHDVGGLSKKDFICAAKLDALGVGA